VEYVFIDTTIFDCPIIGCSSFNAPVVQMPRSVRLVRHADLLDSIASIPNSWPSPQTTIRHKCEVKRGEYWKDTAQTVIKAIGDLKMASHDDWDREQCRLLGIMHGYTKTSKCEWYRGGQDWRRQLNRPDIWSPHFYSLFYFITDWGGGGVWAGWKKRRISTLYVDINTKQHTVLDTWQACIYCRCKFCCRQNMRYHVDIVLWASKTKW
jgi:hypothetical protein